jgi:CRP-like cAMP-binding protein
MLTKNFLKGRRRDELSPIELDAVESSICEVRILPARRTIVRAGEAPSECMFLIEGFMDRHVDDDAGGRQMLALHVPGDFVDLHAYPLRKLDHDNATITECTVGIVHFDRLREIQISMPNVAHYLWLSTLMDAAIHREWIFRQSRLNAVGKIAHFFSETECRLNMIERVEGGEFALPIVQSDLADITGLTPVHVNRCLKSLHIDNVVDFKMGRATVKSHQKLHELGKFDPSYLV